MTVKHTILHYCIIAMVKTLLCAQKTHTCKHTINNKANVGSAVLTSPPSSVFTTCWAVSTLVELIAVPKAC